MRTNVNTYYTTAVMMIIELIHEYASVKLITHINVNCLATVNVIIFNGPTTHDKPFYLYLQYFFLSLVIS